MKKVIVVWNQKHGDTRVFASLQDYKDFAIDNTMNDPYYSAWSDEIYEPEFGKNIFDCEQLDLWEFKNILS